MDPNQSDPTERIVKVRSLTFGMNTGLPGESSLSGALPQEMAPEKVSAQAGCCHCVSPRMLQICRIIYRL